ncbi:MAG: D-alanyl-D-alanine carboxypeptidase [Lachnospiraceae bacterium]|nr:D-alanyl-D-alanine carboxypeptidase [Lachnospiraceae bacterium]
MLISKKTRVRIACGLCSMLFLGSSLMTQAVDYAAEAENRKYMEIQSDDWKNWPAGPSNGAEGAILMDADTGAVLYAKNIDTKEYPASITKVMTALVVMENCDMEEQVTFSHEAVYSIERGSSNVGMDEGQSMTVRESLYCLLLASANEVANALAEHVAGSVDAFADMMNAKAAELGCTNTNFVNPHGLHDDNHYTTAHDMALISRAFYENETLREMAGTISYDIIASANQPDSFQLMNHHRMLPGCMYGSRYNYEYAVGGKTGYTVIARETLVTFAKKDDMNLICVIMKEEPHAQYTDSEDLFEYGFNNFKTMKLSDAVETGTLNELGLNGATLTEDGYITMPAKFEASDLEFQVDGTSLVCAYKATEDQTIVLGSTGVEIAKQETVEVPAAETVETETEENKKEIPAEGSLLQNIVKTVFLILMLALIGALVVYVKHQVKRDKEQAEKRRAVLERMRKRREED